MYERRVDARDHARTMTQQVVTLLRPTRRKHASIFAFSRRHQFEHARQVRQLKALSSAIDHISLCDRGGSASTSAERVSSLSIQVGVSSKSGTVHEEDWQQAKAAGGDDDRDHKKQSALAMSRYLGPTRAI